jgi:hypothetical protein
MVGLSLFVLSDTTPYVTGQILAVTAATVLS